MHIRRVNAMKRKVIADINTAKFQSCVALCACLHIALSLDICNAERVITSKNVDVQVLQVAFQIPVVSR